MSVVKRGKADHIYSLEARNISLNYQATDWVQRQPFFPLTVENYAAKAIGKTVASPGNIPDFKKRLGKFFGAKPHQGQFHLIAPLLAQAIPYTREVDLYTSKDCVLCLLEFI